MKRHLITGLAIILPIYFTYVVFQFFIGILTSPFQKITATLLTALSGFGGVFTVFSSPLAISLASNILILVTLFFSITLLGFLFSQILFHHLLFSLESLIKRIPFFGDVYSGLKELLMHATKDGGRSFRGGTPTPFPSPDSRSMGFIPGDDCIVEGCATLSSLSPIYVPGTPNPLMGYLMLLPKGEEKMHEVDVEEAIKFVISCGIVAPKGQKPSETN